MVAVDDEEEWRVIRSHLSLSHSWRLNAEHRQIQVVYFKMPMIDTEIFADTCQCPSFTPHSSSPSFPLRLISTNPTAFKMKRAVFVQWPDAPLSESLVRRSLSRLYPDSLDFVSKPECRTDELLLQWSTYDVIDHEITLLNPSSALSSSYIIRKALIRKHFLHRCIHSYITKYPNSILSSSVPRTWDLEISFADELDELWADELWDLSEELDSNSTGKWWILKPGMADRGMGIRLFNSKESLQDIFESFEGDSDAEGDSSGEPEDDDTNVVTSQLRHFVIQVCDLSIIRENA